MEPSENWIFSSSRPWVRRAACAGMPVEDFYGECGSVYNKPKPGLKALWDEAKKVCQTCPVLQECRRDSLGEEFGVWGGRDQYERHLARRELAAQIRQWPREDRLRLARRLRSMRRRGMSRYEIRRLTGVMPRVYEALMSDLRAWREEQEAQGAELPYEKGRPFTEAQKRRVIALREEQGLSYRQIAGVVGCSHRLVQSTLKDRALDLEDRPVLTDWPTAPPQRDAWVRYANRYADADYVGQTEDGSWYLLKVNTKGGWTTRWFKADLVRPGRTITPVIRERKTTNGKKVRPHIHGERPRRPAA